MNMTSSQLKSTFFAELKSEYRSEELEYFWKCIYEDLLHFGLNEITNEEMDSICQKLKNGEPIEYITGWTYFYDFKLGVSPSVLIPRPETEELVDLIIKDHKHHDHKLHILEIGTGSGCIALALKKHLPNSCVSTIDISQEALDKAAQNAIQLNLDIEFIKADFLDDATWSDYDQYDIIVSNPPYIAPSEMPTISDATFRYEPDLALYSPEEDPMVFYRLIALFGVGHLAENGHVYAELNPLYASETRTFYLENYHVYLIKDIQGKDRILRGQFDPL